MDLFKDEKKNLLYCSWQVIENMIQLVQSLKHPIFQMTNLQKHDKKIKIVLLLDMYYIAFFELVT